MSGKITGRSIMGEEMEKYRESHQPIQGLKEGDKLLPKDSVYHVPAFGQIIEVYRLIPNPKMKISITGGSGSNHECDTFDFTSLFEIDGEISEFAFDSRYFQRVE